MNINIHLLIQFSTSKTELFVYFLSYVDGVQIDKKVCTASKMLRNNENSIKITQSRYRNVWLHSIVNPTLFCNKNRVITNESLKMIWLPSIITWLEVKQTDSLIGCDTCPFLVVVLKFFKLACSAIEEPVDS